MWKLIVLNRGQDGKHGFEADLDSGWNHCLSIKHATSMFKPLGGFIVWGSSLAALPVP